MADTGRGGRRSNPGGRPPGSPNKSTMEAREAIGRFVDGNAHRLQDWLDAIAQGTPGGQGVKAIPPNPEKAFQLFQSVIEYHVPKLGRTELTGKDGKALGPVTIHIVGRDGDKR